MMMDVPQPVHFFRDEVASAADVRGLQMPELGRLERQIFLRPPKK